jgi:hypothetical protein
MVRNFFVPYSKRLLRLIPLELIQELNKSKQWFLPDALKEKTVPEINDILIHTLDAVQTLSRSNLDITSYKV